jgi:hypothetical protein
LAVAWILTARPAFAVVGGNISISWRIPNAPTGGLTNITFPMTVGPETLHQSGTYFAMQFTFAGSCGAYTGLQPRPDLNGHARLQGVFSSFHNGATSTDSHCSNGADGGPGVSCSTQFDAVYGHEYALTVQSTGNNTWTGTATDTVTGISNPIGQYTLPSGCGNIEASQGGFVEYYLAIPSCAQMPYIDVTFGGPSSSPSLMGSATSNGEYGNATCLGNVNYKSYVVGSGVRVTRGWIMAPDAGAALGGNLDAAASSDGATNGGNLGNEAGADVAGNAGGDADGYPASETGGEQEGQETGANTTTSLGDGDTLETPDGAGAGPTASSSSGPGEQAALEPSGSPPAGCACHLEASAQRKSPPAGSLGALALAAVWWARRSRRRLKPGPPPFGE